MAHASSAQTKRPPLVETALSVQFELLPKFHNVHLGLFWEKLGSDWPNVEDAPPLEPQFERFENGGWSFPALQFRVMQTVPARTLIRNSAGDKMIQIQNGRLGYNWLGAAGRDYPRYSVMRAEFLGVLNSFQKFANEKIKTDIVPDQWEITYVNHVPQGSLWGDLRDIERVFQRPPLPLVHPEDMKLDSINFGWSCEIVPKRGRLHVQIQHGTQPEAAGKKELFVLTLTARGPITEQKMDPCAGLDLGHATILRAFWDLTTEFAHEYWGINREGA
jgi:uncharacterized protein (TIGR04255 family)